MLGAFRVVKARRACVQALHPFVARPQMLGPWPPQFWRDPFVIGFVTYVIGTVTKLVTRGKLNTEQRGRVLIGTLKDVGAPPNFIDQVQALSQARHPDFMLGGRNAETVITYVMNMHPMPGDPDVATATELAKGTTLTGTVGRDEIGGSLMHMLFTQVVQKRLGV